jgi:predicted DNA-binding transcriptional regulator AlpA
VDLLSVIRRWHGREQLSIREIARRTGLSRNTIRKYLANGELAPKYPPRLPFPDPPMGGKVGPTMQESVHKWRQAPRRLAGGRPQHPHRHARRRGLRPADTFGGEIIRRP